MNEINVNIDRTSYPSILSNVIVLLIVLQSCGIDSISNHLSSMCGIAIDCITRTRSVSLILMISQHRLTSGGP